MSASLTSLVSSYSYQINSLQDSIDQEIKILPSTGFEGVMKVIGLKRELKETRKNLYEDVEKKLLLIIATALEKKGISFKLVDFPNIEIKDECMICLKGFDTDTLTSSEITWHNRADDLSPHHPMHRLCAIKWISKNKKEECPGCREVVKIYEYCIVKEKPKTYS